MSVNGDVGVAPRMQIARSIWCIPPLDGWFDACHERMALTSVRMGGRAVAVNDGPPTGSPWLAALAAATEAEAGPPVGSSTAMEE